MAAYGRVTLNRGGRNSRFDCSLICYFPIFKILAIVAAAVSDTQKTGSLML